MDRSIETASEPAIRASLSVQEITIHTDTREIFANAKHDVAAYGLDDYFIVDVGSHHVETDSWDEILEYIEDRCFDSTVKGFRRTGPPPRSRGLSMNPQA
jgi:hypothetical protein